MADLNKLCVAVVAVISIKNKRQRARRNWNKNYIIKEIIKILTECFNGDAVV